MPSLLQDLRYALRQIRRAPGFALTAVLTLAVGIGSTTAIFSFVDGVLLQPLAYHDSGKLVALWQHVPFLEGQMAYTSPNPRQAVFWREGQTTLSSLVVLREGTTGVSAGPSDHPTLVGRVSTEPTLLNTLGIQPALGRDFLPDEGAPGHTDRVILSWNLWQTLLAGDPAAVGKTIQVGNSPVTVIGVLPRNFYFPKANELTSEPQAQQSPAVDILTPRTTDVGNTDWNGGYGNIIALARLRPGVTPAQAQAELTTLDHAFVRQAPAGAFGPADAMGLSAVVQPLHQVVTGRASRGLYLLLAAVCSVLLVACLNLANAQLARVLSRDREAALRTALGASAWSLIKSTLLEAVLLSAVGTALGIAFATFAVRHFAAIVHVAIPRAGNITLNPTVLAAAALCTVGSTILFGALPALHFLRVRPQAALGSAGRAAGSSGGTTLRRSLIAAQVLACTALLLLTTLFTRNLRQLLHADQGYNTGGIVMATVRLQGKAFTEPAIARFHEGALDRLQHLPGVTSAALVSSILSQGEMWLDVTKLPGATNEQEHLTQLRWISPDYFSTTGQHILSGRALNAGDRTVVPEPLAPGAPAPAPDLHAPPTAAVLSQGTAKALWPNQDPLGRIFQRGDEARYVVVGVVADARTNSPHEPPTDMAFLPFWDNPSSQVLFLVRSSAEPAALIPAVRSAIWAQNPTATIADVRPFQDAFEDTLAPERLQTGLLAGFGVAALLLALLGIYGTLSYSIGRRTQEFGIRMALGASRANVYWITLREVAVPIGLGLLGGWLASLVAIRITRSLLQGTPTTPPGSVAAVFATLIAATLIATALPCRRAAQLEPMDALRTE